VTIATGAGSGDGPSHVLDNAVWHSLVGAHSGLAVGTARARRYERDVSVFHAVLDDSDESWRDLAALALPGGVVVLFRGSTATPPAGWERVAGGAGIQMVLTGALGDVPELPALDPATGRPVTMRPLAADDVDDMLALVALTEPGPFEPRTIELGGYVGIFHDGQLMAMAGQRLRPPGCCEVSAVCTHPDARRRGYASIVTAHVATAIAARGEMPCLHLAATNAPALAAYERLGFTTRRMVSFVGYRVPH